jgi:8-oxo-dGTP pyrophosphatase MutT (NUDIX family)
MFIGGGKKKKETNSLCASREIYEETKRIIGPISYLHEFIENNTFKCRPVSINRDITRKKKNITIKMRIHIYFVRIPYIHDISQLFKNKGNENEKCYNELSDITYVNMKDLDKIKKEFFEEDLEILKTVNKESDLNKLININQRKQLKTLSVNLL